MNTPLASIHRVYAWSPAGRGDLAGDRNPGRQKSPAPYTVSRQGPRGSPARCGNPPGGGPTVAADPPSRRRAARDEALMIRATYPVRPAVGELDFPRINSLLRDGLPF